MNELQKLVAGMVREYKLETTAEIRYIDLVSEIGELGKELLTANDYGKTSPNIQKPSENLISEVGDILFSLTCIANTLEIDIEAALRGSMEKYRNRFAQSGKISSDISIR